MKTWKGHGPVIPGSNPAVTMQALEAPARPGQSFLLKGGGIGHACGCGYIVSGRTQQAIQGAILEHELARVCDVGREKARDADEEHFKTK